MAISKTKKEDILGKLTDIAKSPSVVFVNFHGLPVTESSELRQTLRDKGVSYYVAKKTLAKKAFNNASIEGEIPALDGEIAIAYGDDLIAPAREVFEFQKKFTDKVTIVGGVFEKVFKSKSEMTAIAEIPDLTTLRGMFVNLINSPIQGFAVALNAIAEKKA